MAQNGRFTLSVRVLAFLALSPEKMHTSATIADSLHTNPVMVRRVFQALHHGGFVVQRKGPQGGAKLKLPAKSIGLGDVFAAVTSGWLVTGEKPIDAVLKRVREDALTGMNETSVATLAKKLRKV